MATAIISRLTGIPIRKDVAMTGEITLTGRVLPIGGLKEKALAAMRHGIKTIIIPDKNKKDLEDIPDEYRKHLTFVPVKTLDEVLEVALLTPVVPIESTHTTHASHDTVEQKPAKSKKPKSANSTEPAVAKSSQKRARISA